MKGRGCTDALTTVTEVHCGLSLPRFLVALVECDRGGGENVLFGDLIVLGVEALGADVRAYAAGAAPLLCILLLLLLGPEHLLTPIDQHVNDVLGFFLSNVGKDLDVKEKRDRKNKSLRFARNHHILCQRTDSFH